VGVIKEGAVNVIVGVNVGGSLRVSVGEGSIAVGISVTVVVFVDIVSGVGADRSMPFASRVKAMAVGRTSEGIGSSSPASRVSEQPPIKRLSINNIAKRIGRKVRILIIRSRIQKELSWAQSIRATRKYGQLGKL